MQEVQSTTAAVEEKSAIGVPIWSRSVGSMKCQLSGLVRPKTATKSATSSSADCSVAAAHEESATNVNNLHSELDSNRGSEYNGANSSKDRTSASNIVSSGLAGLGAYSSSGGSENDEESN